MASSSNQNKAVIVKITVRSGSTGEAAAKHNVAFCLLGLKPKPARFPRLRQNGRYA